ncbi:MAG: TonB-dependent receptor [Ideonella sp.]|nr:TonB-dependent receptor [Ideonella sp.]
MRRSRGSALAAFIAAGWLCQAVAQESGATIEVTGSRIRGLQGEPSTPVQVVTREDIQRSGASHLSDVLNALAVSAGGGSTDINGSGSFAPGASAASLRGLGRQGTLVLLNSRRLAPYPLPDYSVVFTNIDALPLEAIERIEVLKIGGAAMYGSDAVAGVINVITRPGFQGVHGQVSHQRSLTSGRFGNTTAGLTAGFGGSSAKDAHLLVSAEFYQRDPLAWGDVLQHVDPTTRNASPSFGSKSTYSWPGNVLPGGALPGCAPENITGGLCRYDRYSRFELVPAAERFNLLISGQQPLAGGSRLFGEALLGRTQTLHRLAQQPYGPALPDQIWGNPQTNASQSFVYRGLPAAHPLNPTGQDDAEFRYRFVDGPSEIRATTVQYRLLGGLSGIWQGFDWEVAAGQTGGRTRDDEQGAFSASGFRQVIGNDDPTQVDPLFFNRAYRIGQANSADVLDRLFPHYGYRGEVTQRFVDAKISGGLMRLPAGMLSLAAGAEWRHERSSVTPSDNLALGDIVGFGLVAADASRTAAAAFAEVDVPVTASLRLGAAARLDKFSGVDARVSPKVGLRWQPDAQWMLRGTLETGFRAPNLTESAQSTQFSFEPGVADTRRCPQAQALARDLRSTAAGLAGGDPQAVLLLARADSVVNNECVLGVASIVRENPNLKPESSRSQSIGFVVSPATGWTVALDAWAILRRNEIGIDNAGDLLAAEAAQPPGVVNRASVDNDRSFSAAERAAYGVTSGALISTVSRFQNLLRTEARGVDLAISGRASTPFGPTEWSVDATYLTRFRNWSATRANWGDNLAGRSGHPRLRGTASVTVKPGAWSHTVSAIGNSATAAQGDYYDTTYTAEGCEAAGYTPGDCRQGGTVRWDYAVAYRGFGNLTLAAHVRNVFRKRAPFAMAPWLNGGGIFPPTDEDPKGRMLRLTMEWRLP